MKAWMFTLALAAAAAPALAASAPAASAPAAPAPAAQPAPMQFPPPANPWQAARGNPVLAEPIVNSVCAACHGANGVSVVPTYPSLAGQHYSYLVKELNDFKSGKRQNPIMNGMVASLSVSDIHNLALYFSEQTPPVGVVQNKDMVAAGEKLWRAGVPSQGVPACAACHGPQGLGIPVEFPRLAAQHAQYVYAQLHAFRTGARANDPSKMMRTIASRLSHDDMLELAQYIRSLP